MAVVLTCRSLVITAVITVLVFIPNNNAQCNDTILWANESANYFSSPNYPNSYPSYIKCQWYIASNVTSSVIVLKVLDFDIEGNRSYCDKVNMRIIDGNSSFSTQITSICGKVTNATFTSTGNFMTVVFYSYITTVNYSSNHSGFEFEYYYLKKPALCGDTNIWANEATNYITTPGYPYRYPSNMECEWHITANISTHVVMLEIENMYIEDTTSSCIYDYIAIYDGNSTESPRLEVFCGQVSNAVFTSTGSSMTIAFHSDVSNQYKGFTLMYMSLEQSNQCQDVILSANENAKYITSPGYSNIYPNNVDCYWHITASLSTNVVVLKLLDFILEESPSCTNDYVAIYDGNNTNSPKLQFLCGQVSNMTLTSSGAFMTIVFHSNSNINSKGFHFEYTSIKVSDRCTLYTDAYFHATETVKLITSPGYPNSYLTKMKCQWLIVAIIPQVVMLKLLDFHTEGTSNNCTSDYVTIYDGFDLNGVPPPPVIASLCGQTPNLTFISTFNSMIVVFDSNSLDNYKGFKFEYSSMDKSAYCEYTKLWAEETAKYIYSPGYPNQSPTNICKWNIETSSSLVIVLKLLQFNLANITCSYDYVTIYDGYSTDSPILQTFCGQAEYTQIISSGTYMTVVFHSATTNSNKGFKLEYTSQKPASCTGVTLTAKENNNYLTSPNYPYLYPRNTDCQWNIKSGSDSSVVALNFSQFTLEGSEPYCINDYVKIFDGPTINSPQIAFMCGNLNNKNISSTKSDMTIVFHSDGANTFKGFNMTYYSKKISNNSEVTIHPKYMLVAASFWVSILICVSN